MNSNSRYKNEKVSFEYLGKHYKGEVVCTDADATIYWFVFDQIDVKPFGGSVEFRIVSGQLQAIKEYRGYTLFILCIKTAIDKHRNKLCN